MADKAEKLGKLLKAAQGAPPSWSDQFLGHPATRAIMGAIDPYLDASRAVGDITNPLQAIADLASHMTGTNAESHLNSAIDQARMATGRGNGTDYYRTAGNIAPIAWGGLRGLGAIADARSAAEYEASMARARWNRLHPGPKPGDPDYWDFPPVRSPSGEKIPSLGEDKIYTGKK
jgi:hypothetical protein